MITAPPIRLVAGAEERLFVRLAGSSGPVTTMLHGLASSSLYWSKGVPLLAADHRLLLPDLLGFGRSPKPFSSTYSAAEHVAWLHRTIGALTDEPCTLVGHSMGALIALHYAATYPRQVRRLALIALPVIGCLPWGHRENGEPAALHRLIAHTRLGARLGGLGIRLVAPLGRYLAPRVQRDLPAEVARESLSVTAASYWRTLEQVVYGGDLNALFDRYGRRVLVIHGTEDRTAPVEPVRTLASRRADIDLRFVQGAGHNPYVSHTADVVGMLRSFMAGVAGSSHPA